MGAFNANHYHKNSANHTHNRPPSPKPLKLAFFSAKAYDRQFMNQVRQTKLDTLRSLKIVYHGFALTHATASLARGAEAVCVFVNDVIDASLLEELHHNGVRAVLLRCAGHDNIDLKAADRLGMFVANVSYSPESVAEFAVTLMQTLNRKTHRAYLRVREGNFNLDGLLGRTLHGKTAGVVGVGRIGLCLARILNGFGCKVLAFDPHGPAEFRQYGEYVDNLDELLSQSDVVSLHCPLVPATRHIMNEKTLAMMKPGAMLVNTSRGGLIDTAAVVSALKNHKLGGLALDVYEGEEALFYSDHSGDIIEDDELARLRALPNVLLCGHQAWFTEESLLEISQNTLSNLDDYLTKRPCKFELTRKTMNGVTTMATKNTVNGITTNGVHSTTNGVH